ncbi:glycosyltransferase [Scytonema sp. NUACC21]
MAVKPLNLFYEEPEKDRWLPLDRYPRQVVRRIIRGKRQPGGMERYFLNLCAGLERIGIPYRINNYRYIQQHPDEVACIVGKPHLLNKIQWKNPILFGPAVYSHPCDDPLLLERLPIRQVLVSCEWFRAMYASSFGNKVTVWASGINTYKWVPGSFINKDIDILLYDKVRWHYNYYEKELITPIKSYLQKRGLKVEVIRYGFYREENFQSLLSRSKGMIFICEHETQGFAYLQTLAAGVPILAWDRGGYWQDPVYFPEKVKFSPVTSVPYWNEQCGIKFKDIDDFYVKLDEFLDKMDLQQFVPRNYILENLSLEKCARHYLEILNQL